MSDISELKDAYDKMVNNLENMSEKRKTRNEQPMYTSPGNLNLSKGQTTKKVADANKSTENSLKPNPKKCPISEFFAISENGAVANATANYWDINLPTAVLDR